MNAPIDPTEFHADDCRRLWSAVLMCEIADATSSRGAVAIGNNVPVRLRTIATARRTLLRFAFDPIADSDLALVVDYAGLDREAVAYGIIKRAKADWPCLPVPSSASEGEKHCPVARYVHRSGTFYYCRQPSVIGTVKSFLAENPLPEIIDEDTPTYKW